MPSKRSRSQEREKKMRARLRLTEEAKAAQLEKDRLRKQKLRAEKLEEEWENDKIKDREAKRSARSRKSCSDMDFARIEMKHYMRKRRQLRDGKQHLLDNLKAKRGMKVLKDEGNLKEFERRNGGKRDEIRDWDMYYRACKSNADKLEANKPDIVQELNEKIRKEKEKERKREEQVEEDGGEWLYCGESGEWYWSGEGVPKVDEFEYETLTDKEIQDLRKQEEIQYEEIMKMRKKEVNEKRRQIEQEKRELMKIPLDPLPERELCEYEKLREKNIKEREAIMEKFGFFNDLNSCKKGMEQVKPLSSSVARMCEKGKTENKISHKNGDNKNKMGKGTQETEYMKNNGDGNVVTEDKTCKPKEVIPQFEPIADYYLHDCLE